MVTNETGKILFGVMFTLISAVGGVTIKQGFDLAALKADHMSSRRIEKHIYVIEKKLGINPHQVDEE
jgi:hypothetical protein